MNRLLLRSATIGFTSCMMFFGALSIAGQEQPTLVPVPDPFPHAVPAPTPTLATPAIAAPTRVAAPAAPVVVCKTAQVAEVYTVTQLVDRCGYRVKNTGLIGAINRRHSCEGESVLAKVFAPVCTCENCASVRKVAEIRCDRDECRCNNNDYIQALIADLSGSSKRVRREATRSLRQCELRVTSDRLCVNEEVPSIYYY